MMSATESDGLTVIFQVKVDGELDLIPSCIQKQIEAATIKT